MVVRRLLALRERNRRKKRSRADASFFEEISCAGMKVAAFIGFREQAARYFAPRLENQTESLTRVSRKERLLWAHKMKRCGAFEKAGF